jgi:acid phosphatase family membrane protein YuiD
MAKNLGRLVLLIILAIPALRGLGDPVNVLIFIFALIMVIAAEVVVRRRAGKSSVPSLSLTEHRLEDSNLQRGD